MSDSPVFRRRLALLYRLPECKSQRCDEGESFLECFGWSIQLWGTDRLRTLRMRGMRWQKCGGEVLLRKLCFDLRRNVDLSKVVKQRPMDKDIAASDLAQENAFCCIVEKS